MRIEYELAGSTKDTSKDGRIVQLREPGIDRDAIATMVQISQQHVSRLLTQYKSTSKRVTHTPHAIGTTAGEVISN